ncbi:hypothetical protein [Haladaptatus sp. DFWS20]|uniref:hypothetical protein n=1 Tax=Haladaptatus sp. DFWS20 TaxID=3403467 RepID=UPI003EBEE2B8
MDVTRKPPGKALSPTAANSLTFSVLSRQTTLSDGAQRPLTECAAGSTECEDTPTTERALLDRAQQHAEEQCPRAYRASTDALNYFNKA